MSLEELVIENQLTTLLVFMSDYLNTISSNQKWKYKFKNSSIFNNFLNIFAKLISPNQKKKIKVLSITVKYVCLQTEESATENLTAEQTSKHQYKITNSIYIFLKTIHSYADWSRDLEDYCVKHCWYYDSIAAMSHW